MDTKQMRTVLKLHLREHNVFRYLSPGRNSHPSGIEKEDLNKRVKKMLIVKV